MSVSSIPQMPGSVRTSRAWAPSADAHTNATGTRGQLSNQRVKMLEQKVEEEVNEDFLTIYPSQR